ncbi:MAG: aldehyde dehydrogenase family protein [Hyphomonas sp.]|uniref:aldehyde dehydrogenase family protein n=1 Tax=Hyphomonas sp. TaxID=87 RepID=UPI0017EB0C9E|nr:aldehyde dehydrogenase family protein [Hyphomonas sp.]MBU3919147.1 aldehyde dehydrogenase family protein [Alphaproteobacteria bacterium]MBA3066920.1 aldehyde dehydrogenase family protein [Hyphomonas sp.]MBU4060576.1 aldehyde dehydrogenase family protein [Alphaproteobacteria bacterium]MBU4165844.1 aldehyde dehydrogenase family protein [Alphaproteobacteria bacterium]MBU4569261.1 aldehyde dehydrogenase family protein [Alphaproteobacteria bacterium]
MPTYKMLVNGALVAGAGAYGVINPATGEAFAEAPVADRAIVDRSLDAALAAFPSWSALSFEVRAGLMLKWADAIEARFPDFARLLTLEQGKPLDQASYEMGGTIACLRYYAAQRVGDKVLRQDDTSRIIEHRRPLGVVAAITPWNFPMILLMIKIGPALITGNTVIAKPAPTTPLTTLLLGETAAGILPPGVFQTLVTGNDLAGMLTSDPRIAYVSFTGSTPTGKRVYAAGADTLKRFTLELGGNDAAIVLDDADVETVAAGIYGAATMNAGQVCMAAKRVYAPRALYGPLCEALGQLADQAIVGDGLEQGTQIGPIQNLPQFQKLVGFHNEAAAKGRIVGGKGILERKGYFVHPTIVADLPDGARLVREEQFGPILPVLAYDDLESALHRANDSIYGLAGTVWTSDPARGEAIARRMVTGTVWVNKHMDVPFDIPFGGAKQSGIGRQQGEEGLHDFTQASVVNVNLAAMGPARRTAAAAATKSAPAVSSPAPDRSKLESVGASGDGRRKSLIARLFTRS